MGGGQGYSQAPPQRRGTKPGSGLPPLSTDNPQYQTRATQPGGAYQAPRNPQAAQMAAFLRALQMAQQQGQGGYNSGVAGWRPPQGQGQGGGQPGMGMPILNRWRPGLPGGGGGGNPLAQPPPQTGGTNTNTAIPPPPGGPPGYVPASGGGEQGAIFAGGRWWKPPSM